MSEQDKQNEPGKDLALPPEPKIGSDIIARPVARGERFTPQNMAQLVQFAQLMARGGVGIPKIFREHPGLCLAVATDATFLGFNPVALAREAYAVGDVLGYQAKVHHSAINNSGLIVGRLKHRFIGEVKGTHKVKAKDGQKDAPAGDLQCIVTGTIVGDDGPSEWISPKLSEITTKNSPGWYVQDPRKQLFYYTVRDWGRIYLPEVMMGIMSVDDLEDDPDVQELRTQAAAPRPTLIDRVTKAREAEDAKKAETAAIDAEVEALAPAKDGDAGEEAAPETDADGAADEPEDGAGATTEPAQVQESDEEPETVAEAIERLKVMTAGSMNLTRLKEAHDAWKDSIADFGTADKFDLNREGDLIVGDRRTALRREKAEQKA